MKSLEDRKQSFTDKGWDQSIPVSFDELCEAGFYYTGLDDKVKCFHCCGTLHIWFEGIVLYSHEKIFPDCHYTALNKFRDKIDINSSRILEQSGKIYENF
jgi:hypothetical protein